MSDAQTATFETLWGIAQKVVDVVPGIQSITTAGHGGYRLSRERRDDARQHRHRPRVV